jgi:hypothetical protein
VPRPRLAAYRWSALLLALGVAVPVACGPDARPQKPCGADPDFTVLISAVDGPLPPSIKVIVTYGSGREEYVASSPARPEILFCDVTDEDGVPLEGGTDTSSGGAGAGGAATEGEGGGPGARRKGAIDGLRCALWTQGPATIEIVAEGYPNLVEDLKREEGSCSLTKELELAPEADAGS